MLLSLFSYHVALRIVQITDLHLLSPGELLMGLDVEQRFHAVLQAARQVRPDAYFFTGDFCAHDPVASVYTRLRPVLDALDAPYYLIPGNHDDRAMMRRAFALHGTGDAPLHYRADVNDRTFIFLDTSPGVLGDDQLAWLEASLREFPRAAIVMHHPPIPLGIRFMDTKYPLRTAERLHDLLTADGIRRRVFCGHYHSVRTVSHRNLDVYLCPPTSFFLNPQKEEFELRERPPGYQLLEWMENGDFYCSAVVVGS